MKDKFKSLFWMLSDQPYQPHWFNRVPTEQVLIKGTKCDCSDIAYALADYCEKHEIPYSFILTLFTNPTLSLHIALVAEGYVYDPIWKLYETPLEEYQKILNGTFSHVFGSWIQKIIL